MANSDELLKALCRKAGIDDWRAVLEGRHVVIDDHVVGLIDIEHEGFDDSLGVYVELDTLPPGREAEIAPLLLQANVHRREPLRGSFGLHAETGRVVYRFEAHRIGHMDADALAGLLQQQVLASSTALRALMS